MAKEKTKLYIAFDDTMNIAHAMHLISGARIAGSGILGGWSLVFRGNERGAYLAVEQDGEGTVPFALWEITESDEHMLDFFQMYPTNAEKHTISVEYTDDSGHTQHGDAILYRTRSCIPYYLPTAEYAELCIKGYYDFGFDTDYLKAAAVRTREAIGR